MQVPVGVRSFLARLGAPTLALGTAAIAVVALSLAFFNQAYATREMERRAEAAAAEAQLITLNGLGLLQAVTDAETGQRGYLLTGRAEFLTPYAHARERAEQALANLSRAAGSQTADVESVQRLRDLSQQRLAIAERALTLDRAGRRDEALRVLPQGREVMEQLRADIDQLVTGAQRRQAATQAERRDFERRSSELQFGLVTVTLLALLLAMAALALERRTARRAAVAQTRMVDALEASALRAEEADKAKSRFLAAASHDLRQPLHALALYISTLERRIESAQGREILANMDGAVRSMSRLFTALLDLARLEAGILKPDPMGFDVQGLLEDVVGQSVDPKAGKAVVRVLPTTLRVRSDPDLLEIALRNLVSNVVKHSRGGRVLLGCRRVGDQVSIQVHDDGQGIPEDQLERLFSEFVRGEQAGSAEGVGLGLAIAERMAKLLGHRLSVRSAVGRGSTFSITVPRDRTAAQPQLEPAPSVSLAGLRILLADDEPLALDAMRRTLEDAGAQVVTADSAEAVRAHATEPFDLHVFDLNLGRDNGLELLKELDGRSGPKVPSLIVTGATTPELLEQLRDAGRSWLTKPVSAAALSLAVGEVLGRR